MQIQTHVFPRLCSAAVDADRGSPGGLQRRAGRLHHVLRAAEENLLQHPHQTGATREVRHTGLRVGGVGGASPSWQWARGGVYPDMSAVHHSSDTHRHGSVGSRPRSPLLGPSHLIFRFTLNQLGVNLSQAESFGNFSVRGSGWLFPLDRARLIVSLCFQSLC